MPNSIATWQFKLESAEYGEPPPNGSCEVAVSGRKRSQNPSAKIAKHNSF